MIKQALNFVQSLVKVIKLQKFFNYIDKKINEDENIDYNAKKINYQQYVKSYIGFRSINDIKKKILYNRFQFI